jgi:hypothetical protein
VVAAKLLIAIIYSSLRWAIAGQTTGEEGMQARSDMLVVGTWSMNLDVYLLPNLEKIATNAIGGEVMPRR